MFKSLSVRRISSLCMIATLIITINSCTTENIYITNPNNFVGGPLDSVIAIGEPLYTAADFAGDTLNSDTGIAEPAFLDPRPADTANPIWSCITRRVDATKFPEKFPLFDPNAELIYPGNLLQGGSLELGTPLPIPLKRGPGTVVMTLVNGITGGSSREITEVNLSGVIGAMNEILSGAPSQFAARFSLSSEEVHSKEQLFFSINAHLKYSSIGEAEGSLSFSRDSDIEFNRYMVKLNQSFYTMALEMPTLGETIFDKSVSADDLGVYISSSNPAVYISSVTFGRIFYLLIESTDSKETIEASINASFSSGLWSGDTDASLKYVSNLENIRIKAFAMGGDAAKMIGAVTTDFATMKRFLAESTVLTTGAPISYTMRYLHDPSQLVKLKLTTEYDIVDCRPVDQSTDFNNIWRYASSSAGVASGNRVYLMENLFPSSGIGSAFPRDGFYAGVLNTSSTFASIRPITFANTVWDPSLNCSSLDAYANDNYSVEKRMVVEGTKFDSSSYTICAVVGPGIQSFLPSYALNTPIYPNNFLDLPGKLSLGFSSKDSIQFVHNGNVLRAPLPETSLDLSDFNSEAFRVSLPWKTETTKHLYTFKYDLSTTTMSIYIDNDTTAAATLSSVAPVRNSASPSLGCMVSNKSTCQTGIGFTYVRGFTGNSIHFWEIRAYGQALPGLSLGSVQAEIVDLYKIQ